MIWLAVAVLVIAASGCAHISIKARAGVAVQIQKGIDPPPVEPAPPDEFGDEEKKNE